MTDKKPLFSVSLKDMTKQTFRSGGPGGQNQNKRDTGVRLIHDPSGARAESREHRTQYENTKSAFKKLVDSPAFKYWIASEVRRLSGIMSAEKAVDIEMEKSKNFKIEVKKEGKWEETEESQLSE